MRKYCFGIDVGGTTVKCGLFKVDGTLVEKWEIRTRTENGGENILPDVAKTIYDKMKEKEIEKDMVTGIGVGVPGPVSEEGRIPGAVNLGWGAKDIQAELTGLTGIPAKAGNDANVAALGETWKGSAQGSKNVIMATLGTGVGGGIIVDGKIVAGAHGAGGEIGHASVDHQEEEACNCGNHGCLEQMASATGIVRLAKRQLKNSTMDSKLRHGRLSAKTVFDAYKDGDVLADKIVNEFGEYLGSTLAVFATVIDPHVIVLGGGVSKAGDPLLKIVKKYYEKYAFFACRETPIVLAQLGNDAGIYGAAKMVVQ